MAKRCPEDFNPWPPFVDIFASVILVMLLFLLITIVNIGYYAQFKHKVSYTASVVTEAPVQPEEQTKVMPTQAECTPSKNNAINETLVNAFSFHKVEAPTTEASKNSLFDGGKKIGNAISYAANKDKKEFTQQRIIKTDLLMTVEFSDKEIFLNSSIKRKIKLFVSDIKRRSKRAEFTLFVSDPTNIISSTISKQISLGRILNVKNIIKRSNINPKKIRLNLQYNIPSGNKNGDITIKVHIP
ncbi:hypothetical protein JHD46_07235 [Sulfurimonas sp. SAG-AH-194-C20]|nr:hypothetical protein [Sulfurimonas sp. SAG-AH-194-C20]MDF1879427.1 hypothetical protein [Sulfurimonas sp. SAG-AH-194-C20]